MTREPVDEAQTLLAELTAELQTLVKAGKGHADNLHNQAMGADMKECPGCRQIVLARTITKLVEGRDDSAPIRTRRDRLSRRERAIQTAKLVR